MDLGLTSAVLMGVVGRGYRVASGAGAEVLLCCLTVLLV